MDLSLTLFKPPRWWDEQQRFVYDNKTHRRLDFSNFDELEKLLYALSKQPKKGKSDAELFSPAIYLPDTTRANKNVTAWAGWCAVDVDDIEINGELNDYVRDMVPDWRFVCYSTASSTQAHPKFRLVFNLSRPIEQSEIRHFWFALNKRLGEIGDAQTKDLSRMYYIPANYAGADNFIFSGDGKSIDVDTLLLAYPYVEKQGKSFLDRLPDSLKAQVLEHRKSKLDNTSFSWTSYRDCPFWPKKLAGEYSVISNTGWYHKMYQIMVAVAARATEKQYPITSKEISMLCREFDMETGNWYENRPIDIEADRALEYVMKNVI